MARPRKPLDAQTRNITSIDRAKRQKEEKSIVTGANQLKNPPDWLVDRIAKNEYRRLVKELAKIEMIGNLDRDNLASFCNAYSNYRRATEELKGQPLSLEKETRYGTTMYANPLVGIQSKYAAEMRSFAALCGLTIDSRLKAAAVKTTKEEDAVSKKFGNI